MYILDEEKIVVNGTWEGDIENLNIGSLVIFTEKRMKGIRVSNYSIIRLPDNKIRLKVLSGSPKIYITYDTLEKIENNLEKINGSSIISNIPENVFVDEIMLKKILDRFHELHLVEGPQGIQGPKGNDGYTPKKNIDYYDGEKGPKGDTGPQGVQGIQGPRGDQGLAGKDGDRGSQGIQGDKGEKGDQGPRGEKGDPGTFIAKVTWGELEGV